MKITLNGIELELLPEKAIYIRDTKILIIADIHLGKTSHFRRNGIPIPGKSAEKDYEQLAKLITKTLPENIIFLGDLFHSDYNKEWDVFCAFMKQFPKLNFILIKGNHDILEERHYKDTCLSVVEDRMENEQFIFTHEPLKIIPGNKINFCGHIHPGFTLIGKGLQRITLPCFYFHKNILILPAFGSLTGLYLLEHEKDAAVFVIVKDKVIEV